MQLDKTRIVVRERGIFDTLDLALHVWRVYAWQLLVTTSLVVVPLALINQLLIGWMVEPFANEVFSFEKFGAYLRYGWTMMILVVVEAPLATALATMFLGKAVFLERPRIGAIVREVWQFADRLVWCHLLLRGVLPAILLLVVMGREQSFAEFDMLLILLFLTLAIRRATAPFLNEIVLLERNPLWEREPGSMTVRKRSNSLHTPSTSDLLHRFVISSVYAVFLTFFVVFICYLVQGVFLGDFSFGTGLLLYCLPSSMWLVASFFAVVRYLSYLDLRIRHEGWEVELRMRAEANRLVGATP